MPRRIVVIGGGVVGLSTAYYCARQGDHVIVLDRGTPTDEGCSFGNAGMIVPSHFVPLAAPGMVALGLKWMWNPASPFYLKPRLDRDLLSWGWKFYRAANPGHVTRAAPLLRDLSLLSRACFKELAHLTGNEFGLVEKGLLMLCKSEHTLAEEAKTAARARQLGLPAEVLDAKQTAALEPGVRMNIAGSVYFPKDCHLSPAHFMATLRRLAQKADVESRWQSEVTGWHAHGQQIEAVRTPQGEFTGDEFVLCGGAWSPLLARELGLKLPLQAGKGYSLTVPKPRRLPQICSILCEARVAVTPMNGSLRFGGTMELAGLDETINPVRVQGIVNAVPRYYPEFDANDFRNLPAWCGLRPCSPDGLPYLGRTRRYANLTIATGHAMMGLSLGPITGRLVAGIVQGEQLPVDIDLLDPNRYS
jgi:D-amino-acid dehydrogenase